jgi:hypothetical protein
MDLRSHPPAATHVCGGARVCNDMFLGNRVRARLLALWESAHPQDVRGLPLAIASGTGMQAVDTWCGSRTVY